jgi:hypothetical protein
MIYIQANIHFLWPSKLQVKFVGHLYNRFFALGIMKRMKHESIQEYMNI